MMSKLTSAIALGIGLAVIPAVVARAQLGDLGDTAKKGATDVVKKKAMEGAAEQAGLGAPGATAVPSPAAGASPAVASPDAATAPAAAASPATAASPASAGTASPPTAEGGAESMLMDQARKKMAPKLP